MGRSGPKKHHYVPKLLLKRFVDDQGWLHYFSKRENGGVRPVRIENAFIQSNLYSEVAEDGSKDWSLESQLHSLETAAEPILRKLSDAACDGKLPNLSNYERGVWDLFFLIQWKRVPDLRLSVTTDEWLQEYFRQTRDELKVLHPEKSDEIDALGEPETEKRLMHNARVGALKGQSSRVLAAMRGRGIALLRIGVPGKAFVIGSRPVVQMAFRDGLSLMDDQTEVWLPISSELAVGAGKIGQAEIIYDLTHAAPIRHLNLAIKNQSTAFASRSHRLTNSLACNR